MCNMLKMADRKAIQIKIWDYCSPMNCICGVRFFEFSLELFGALHKISDKIFKRLLLPYFSSNFNQTLWKVRNRGEIQACFLWRCVKF